MHTLTDTALWAPARLNNLSDLGINRILSKERVGAVGVTKG